MLKNHEASEDEILAAIIAVILDQQKRFQIADFMCCKRDCDCDNHEPYLKFA